MRTNRALLATGLSLALAVACALDDRSLTVHPALTPAGGTTSTGGTSSSGGSSGEASGGSSAGKANSGGSVGQSGSDAGGSGSGGDTSGSGGDTSNAGSSGSDSGGSGAGGTPSSGGNAGSAGTAGSSAGTAGSGGGGAIGLPYFEDFEDSLAQGFVSGLDGAGPPVFGDWPIVNLMPAHVYEGAATGDANWAVGGDLGWTDQWVEVDARFTEMSAGADSAVLYLAMRFQSFNRYYIVELRGTGSMRLRKRVDGSTTDLGSTNVVQPSLGGWFRLAVIADGSDLSVLLGGTEEITATDAALGSGGIALGANEATVQFDMVAVSDPSP